jgi:hypothetical protein
MDEYKLDAYLKSLCSEHPEYMNLYSTWNLNKKTCSNALKTIVINYPHFSMHDASHSEAILSKIEMLLGKRINHLSPTDTWLILHAAYTHDLGMVLKWDEIEKEWETPKFQNFLLSLKNGTNNELRNAAKFICDLKEQNKEPLLWPLKTYRYVNLINAAYFRGQHSHISRKYIDVLGSDLAIDLGHNNMVQPRLLKLLGQICELHTAPLEQVLTLNYQTDGFGSDYAHPRFVAMLLRLGDLLDIDNGRFNTACELVAGGLPDSSVPHKEKHDATTHILVTPEKIEFSSDCPDPQAYLETRNFVTWLEAEVDFLTKYWARIAPAEIGGYAPRFDEKKLLINGVPDIEGVAGMRFEISQEKAFQIIEGSNIYKNRFVFIREVIQNAIDASKIQLWRDVVSGTYRAWIGDKDSTELQPYDLDEKIYQNYPIEIKLLTLPDGATQVSVIDRGTGISLDSFKRMCNVGISNSESIQAEIQTMPTWLRPTAGFGVGLQSIFLLTDQFEIDTNTGTEAFHAVAHSHRMGGYLQLQRSEKVSKRGTRIRITFRMPKNFDFSILGDTQNYLSVHYDPLSSEDHTGEARMLEAIKSNCGESLFPIQVSCSEDSLKDFKITEILPACNAKDKNWKVTEGRYRFLLDENCSSIKLWDMDKAAYGEFWMTPKDRSWTEIRFKGIEVDKHTPMLKQDGISALVDVYGLDTKDTISLDRSSLTEQGSKNVTQILNDMFNVYKNCVLEQLINYSSEKRDKICKSPKSNFNLYSFWCSCDPEQREKIPKDMLKNIREKATVLVKNDKQQYSVKEKDVTDLIPFDKDTYFINLEKFTEHKGPNSYDYEKICSILNATDITDITEKQIIADKRLIKAANAYLWDKLIIPNLKESLLLYTISRNDKQLLSVDDNTKSAVLHGLSGQIKGMQYNNFFYKNKIAKRYAIPCLDEYSDLAVEQLPRGIAMPIDCNVGYAIIAPFVREEAEKRKELTKEGFIDMILSSPTFSNLVKYVLEHSCKKDSLKEDTVIEAYKHLIEDYYDAMRTLNA